MRSKLANLILFAAVLSLVTGTARAKLVAYWPLNEGSGTTAADASGNNHDGTIQGTPTWVDGPPGYGTALDYNGQNPAAGYVDCGTWNPSAATGQLTVAFWAKWKGYVGPDNWQGVVGKRDSWDDTGAGNNSMWEIEISPTNNAISFFRGGSYPGSGGKVLPVGQWTHIAVTFDGSTQVFYVDGVETGRGAFQFGPKTDAMITIGCDNNGGWNCFNGTLDEVRLYDTALSAAEVKKLSAPLGASTPTPADGSVLTMNFAQLKWTAGSTAAFHEVYFGTSYDDVYNGAGDTFRGQQPLAFLLVGFAGTLFPEGLPLGQKYFWRVDEVEAGGTKYKGDIWSFFIPPKKAYQPSPADTSTFVDPNVDLSWSGGLNGIIHTVYFGESFEDVNQATGGVPSGDATFDPGPLQYDKVYWWRVDEFDTKETYKGDVWSFRTTPPGLGFVAQDIYENIQGGLAEFKSSGDFPDNPTSSELVNIFECTGWGDAKDNYGGRLHGWLYVPQAGEYTFWIASDDSSELWLSTNDDPANGVLVASVEGWTGLHEWEKYPTQKSQPVRLEADRYYITALWKDGTSGDSCSVAWQGPGIPTREVIAGKYMKPYEAFSAFGAQPSNQSVNVPQDTLLSWKPGKKAAQHLVYFGQDEQAVAEATSATSGIYQGKHALDETFFDPGPLDWNAQYFWRVDEVNDAEPQSPWIGSVWSFTTADFIVVDDFESYTDEEDVGARIYETWIDGYADGSSGSIVGYLNPPFAEQTIVHGGRQSMPLDYNNTVLPYFSEARTEWASPQNWTVNGVKNLTLFFRGQPLAYAETNGSFTMSSSGSDIWNGSDEFRFAYKRLSANGVLAAKVDSIGNTNTWAKAGVMIRETLAPGSKFAYVAVTPGQGVSFGWRQFADDPTCSSVTQAGVAAPQWVKLTRTGDNFTAQYSADGQTWLDVKNADGTVATANITMAGSLYAGLCVTSHDAALVTTAQFSNAAATGASGSWQMVTIGPGIMGNSVQPLYVALEDSTNKRKMVTHPDPQAVLATGWTEWTIPLSDFTGVSLTKIKRLYIGVGDPDNPVQDGTGLLYFDDIRVTKP
jgi:hypothetical protein